MSRALSSADAFFVYCCVVIIASSSCSRDIATSYPSSQGFESWLMSTVWASYTNRLPVRPRKPVLLSPFFTHQYLLTPCCRVLLEKLTGLQLVKKFPSFHGTRRFITALTTVRHLSLSWASPIQSIYPHPTSWRSILILSTHLRLGLPSGLLPSGFPSKSLYILTYSMVQSFLRS